MNKIKVKIFGNFVLTITLICTVLFTIGLAIFSRYFIGGEEGKLVSYAIGATVLFQIPTSIYLIKSLSKQKDFIVDGNQVLQNNEVVFTRKDIVSINKINIIKTEIKYIKDNIE